MISTQDNLNVQPLIPFAGGDFDAYFDWAYEQYKRGGLGYEDDDILAEIKEEWFEEWGGKVPKSLKDFLAALKAFDSKRFGNEEHLIDETYGMLSNVYATCADMGQRTALEQFLDENGFIVQFDYWPDHPIVEVSVQYFRGHRWRE